MTMNLTLELYPAQDDFVHDQAQFAALIGGVGSGKTYAGAVKALLEACQVRGLGQVVSPTYPMLRDSTLRTFLDLAGPLVADFHKAEMIVSMRNDSEVLFRSAEKPERLRGPNLAWAYVDEAALCPPDTWPILLGRLRYEGRAGRGWITTTPKGRNWVYETFGQADGAYALHRTTTRANPYLAPEFIASLEAAYSGDFARQELLGEFVAFEGLVYEEFDRSLHVWPYDAWPQFAEVVAGVDEGYTNPSVILVIGLDNDGRAYAVDEFHRRRVLQGDVVAEARRLKLAWNVSTFYVDPSAAGLIAEMRAVGLNAVASGGQVLAGIQAIKTRLVRQADNKVRLYVSPGCVNLLAELESYCWKGGRTGRRDETEKVNDHGPDALRYALVGSGGRVSWADVPTPKTARSRWELGHGGNKR